jgi:hypothetical protein
MANREKVRAGLLLVLKLAAALVVYRVLLGI